VPTMSVSHPEGIPEKFLIEPASNNETNHRPLSATRFFETPAFSPHVGTLHCR